MVRAHALLFVAAVSTIGSHRRAARLSLRSLVRGRFLGPVLSSRRVWLALAVVNSASRVFTPEYISAAKKRWSSRGIANGSNPGSPVSILRIAPQWHAPLEQGYLITGYRLNPMPLVDEGRPRFLAEIGLPCAGIFGVD